MELAHEFTVPAPVDEAWATFMDLHRVGSCFPGATVTDATDDGFTGTVKVKLGPIALVYAGSGEFVERDDTAHRAVIDAKGKDKRGNGTAGATVTIQLSPDGEGTHVAVTTDLAITGKPAQFGRGVMQDVSDKLLQQFVTCIEGQFDVAQPDTDRAAADDASPVDGGDGAGAPVADAPAETAADAAPDPAAPAPAAPVRAVPSTPRTSAASDTIDLGSTVLPVLVKSYAPYALAAAAGLVLGYLVGRRSG